MSGKTYERMRAFIITPFGKKEDAQGSLIDFDAVREKLIEPALDQLGISGRTTGEIIRAGNIHADMFQRLLTADLVVAEVSIHNANVFYELGVRHALRQHRTVMLRSQGDKYPFDLETYRYLAYDRVNPAASVNDLVEALRATLDSTEQDSPVFRSLPTLREQERSHFLPVPIDFREEVEQALANSQRGDLALLALETSGFPWGIEGLRVVGHAQFRLNDHNGARASWEDVRGADADDKEANTLLGTIYQRLGELTLSDQALKRVLANDETTTHERAEAYTLQGRNAKACWIADWKGGQDNPHAAEEWRQRALRSPYLQESYSLCQKGFGEDLNHFYSGLNALAMLTVMIELATGLPEVWAEDVANEDEAVQKLAALKRQRDTLSSSVGLSIKASKERLVREANAAKDIATRSSKMDQLRWTNISESDHLCLIARQPSRVRAGYRSSLTGVEQFYRDSASTQLLLYKELGVLPDNVNAALEVVQPHQQPGQPTQLHVFIFTGHRVDGPGHDKQGKEKRFPQEMEGVARTAIRMAIEEELQHTTGETVGIAGGASGGDTLFHEVCAELNVPTLLYLALPREDYVRESVQDAGPDWVRRFNNLYGTLKRRELAHSKDMPRWLREKGNEYTVWERSNLWMLSNAIALDQAGGGTNLTLIALWNKKKGDGPGGTEDMVAQAAKRGARTIILPTETLFGLAK